MDHRLDPPEDSPWTRCEKCGEMFNEDTREVDADKPVCDDCVWKREDAEAVELRREFDLLKLQLEKYGQHLWSCALQHGGKDCDCGFSILGAMNGSNRPPLPLPASIKTYTTKSYVLYVKGHQTLRSNDGWTPDELRAIADSIQIINQNEASKS